MHIKQILSYCKIYYSWRVGLSVGSINRYSVLNQRYFSAVVDTNRPILDVTKDHTLLKLSSWPHSLCLNHLWLRDHCRTTFETSIDTPLLPSSRGTFSHTCMGYLTLVSNLDIFDLALDCYLIVGGCDECYNNKTNQRNLDLLSIPSDIHPIECRMEDTFLVVLWPGGHRSKYPVNWLWDHSYEGYLHSKQQWRPTLWDKSNVSSVARVGMADYMSRERGLRDIVKSVVNFGVGIVENVPATIAATEEVVVRMAPVMNTFFGGMWEFSDVFAHSDTAYTSQALGAHNDNTYFNEAAGLQVFHCLHHDGEGGENLLVDGFRAARDFRETHSKSYDLLTSTPIEAEYLEPGQHYSCIAPVLRLQPLTMSLEQVRFNLYDRAPMSLRPEEVRQFYEALRLFAMEVQRPTGEWWIKLKPGLVIFIDNWRVLHGRAAYTGSRTMGGCYVNRSDFLSKARVFGFV